MTRIAKTRATSSWRYALNSCVHLPILLALDVPGLGWATSRSLAATAADGLDTRFRHTVTTPRMQDRLT